MAGLMYKWLLLSVWSMHMAFSANIPVNRPTPHPYPLLTTPHCAGQADCRPPTTYYALNPIPYSLSPVPNALHPYFVSVSELEWNRQEKQVELSCKIYTDDFEEALKIAGGEKADLVRGDAARNKTRMEAYIRAHFKVKINGKPLTLQFIGAENDQEATWCYLQSAAPEAPANMEIVNTLLFETKKEQVNIVHLRSGDARKSFRLVNPDQLIYWKAGT